MDGENLTTSLLHWGAYSSIRRPWSSNLETFLHLLSISDKRNHRWLFLLLVLYCLLSVQFISGTQSCLTLCKTHGLQATGCQASLFITNSQSLSNSCPSSWWCHPPISSSVVPFSSSSCYFCYRICQQQKTKQKPKMMFSCLTSNPSITVKNNLFYMKIKVYTELNKIMDFHWISKSSNYFQLK